MSRSKLKGVKKHRRVGHKTKYNKKSVVERRRLRRLRERQNANA